MGHDTETYDSCFVTELLVDGENSGMFISRELFPRLKRFYSENDIAQVRTHLELSVASMLETALFHVESDAIVEFLVSETQKAK